MKTTEKTNLVGYKLTRPKCGGWMFLGVTPSEVGEQLATQLENEGLLTDGCGHIVIEAFEITQDEIDNMPEFPGW